MFSPAEIAQNYLKTARVRTSMPHAKTLVSAFLAGMFIALAGAASSAASCTVENASLARLIAACVFPAGLAMVVVAGGELFTGSCLYIIAVFHKTLRLTTLVKKLLIIYFGNFLGSVFISAVVVFGRLTDMFGGAFADALISSAGTKCSLGFVQALALGVGCNILVCIAVWMSCSAQTAMGKIVCVFFPVASFILCGFEHSVANMYYLSAGIIANEYAQTANASITVFNALIGNLLPVTLGNVIGGIIPVGGAYTYIYLKK